MATSPSYCAERDMTPTDQRRIVGENAVAAYGLLPPVAV
jgi:hypothetical protein